MVTTTLPTVTSEAMLFMTASETRIELMMAIVHWLGIAMFLVAIAIGAFFRDPDRVTPTRGGIVISGADGRVTGISECTLPDLADGHFRRVSVFMSPLNVHVNRASVGGEVTALRHTCGEFRAAFGDHASELNERNLIVIDSGGVRHAMLQVAGYLARRIVCRLREHDRVEAGQRIGLIMFGSRVDHLLPLHYRVVVRVGERVRAGESVIGELTQ
jgi:phosphatidylserine decarboxylase